MARHRHRLDLLPLLDVFMVVLFVFATIQEQRLDDSTRGEAQMRERVAEVEEALRQTQAREQARDREQQELQAVAGQRQEVELEEVKAEAEHLRQELEQVRQDFEKQREETRAELARVGVPEEALERLDVLSRVLDRYSVFEIEVTGETTDSGDVLSHCCFRADPLQDQWHSCGLVPPRSEDRAQWIDEGAGGLSDALRRTKGGNAMTLVRNDRAAGHWLSRRMVEQLRERFSDHQFYAEEDDTLVRRCTP